MSDGWRNFDVKAYNARLARGLTGHAVDPGQNARLQDLPPVAHPVSLSPAEYRAEVELHERYPLIPRCRAAGLPVPVAEHHFHAHRKWRFDYAWPAHMVAVELDGGQWIEGGGRHNRREGFTEDQRKLNAATLLGWRCLRYTPERLDEAVRDLRSLFTPKEA